PRLSNSLSPSANIVTPDDLRKSQIAFVMRLQYVMRLNSRGSQERARAMRKLPAIFILVALALLDGGGPAGAADVICYNCPPQWTDFASIDRVGLAIALRAVPPQLRFARHRIMPSRFHDRTAGISPARLVAGRATRNDRHALGSDWRF